MKINNENKNTRSEWTISFGVLVEPDNHMWFLAKEDGCPKLFEIIDEPIKQLVDFHQKLLRYKNDGGTVSIVQVEVGYKYKISDKYK
jgi:hypothetical protein